MQHPPQKAIAVLSSAAVCGLALSWLVAGCRPLAGPARNSLPATRPSVTRAVSPSTSPAWGGTREVPGDSYYTRRTHLFDQGRRFAVLATRSTSKTPWTAPDGWFIRTVDSATGAQLSTADLPHLQPVEMSPVAGRLVMVWGQRPRDAYSGVRTSYTGVWDVLAGRQVVEFRNSSPDGGAIGACLDGAGTRALTCGKAEALTLWDASTGKMLNSAAPLMNFSKLALSNDGKFALAAGQPNDKTVHVWDFEQGEERTRLAGHSGSISWVAFSPDGKTCASSADDGTLRLWNLADGKERRQVRLEVAWVRRFEFSEDGRHAIVWAVPKHETPPTMRVEQRPRDVGDAVFVVDLDDGQTTKVAGIYDRPIRAVGITADGRQAMVLRSGSDDVERIEPVRDSLVSDTPNPAGVTSAFAPEHPSSPGAIGKELHAFTFDAGGRVQRVNTGRQHFVWGTVSIQVRLFAGFLSDDKAFAAGPPGTAVWLDLKSFSESASSNAVPVAKDDPPMVQSISPDGRYVLSEGTGKRGRQVLWETKTGFSVKVFDRPSSVVGSAFFPDGSLLALSWEPEGLKREQNEIRFVRTSDGAAAGTVKIPGCYPGSLAFSADGKLMAVRGRDESEAVTLFDLDTAKVVASYVAPVRFATDGIAFSADGKHLVARDRLGFVVWDVATRKSLYERAVLSPFNIPAVVAISPDGRRVLTGDDEFNLNLWDVDRRELLGTSAGHTGPITSLAFSPDGKRALSASNDQTIRFWELVP